MRSGILHRSNLSSFRTSPIANNIALMGKCSRWIHRKFRLGKYHRKYHRCHQMEEVVVLCRQRRFRMRSGNQFRSSLLSFRTNRIASSIVLMGRCMRWIHRRSHLGK